MLTKSVTIPIVIDIVKKQILKFKNPVVTEVAENYNSPFHVLISCILSLRTQDKTTASASRRLFTIADTPDKMVKLTTKQIEKAIYPVGFYRTKAKHIKKMCKIIIKKHNRKVPEDFGTLMKLKGVGRKTANIVMTYGFGKKNYIAVDTHVHRIPNRLGWVKTKKPEDTEKGLIKIVPKKYWVDINNVFVTFGQNICRPVCPKCDACPVLRYCDFGPKYLRSKDN